jgi:NADH-quinone oxidoreductase subunit D
MDYLAGMNMNLGYSLAVEKLCGMKIPEKAQVIRVIIAELNRIASHLVGMGAYGLDLGTFSPFLYAFREREMILDLFEEVCGARLTYSYITIGGAHDDLPEGWSDRCQKFLDYFKPRIEEYHTLLTRNHIFVQRTANIGILPRDLALSYGCTGPMLRGSLDRAKGDPDWDLRKVEPYCGYETYDFNAIVPPFAAAPADAVIGDCWHRFYVRMVEIIESMKLIEQGLQRYKTAQGSHRIEPPRHLPAGEAYMETECPRGQMGFYVVGRTTKDPVPLRVRARSSSFSNLSVTNEICRGCLIADVPAIVGSIDIVMGEIDR